MTRYTYQSAEPLAEGTTVWVTDTETDKKQERYYKKNQQHARSYLVQTPSTTVGRNRRLDAVSSNSYKQAKSTTQVGGVQQNTPTVRTRSGRRVVTPKRLDL